LILILMLSFEFVTLSADGGTAWWNYPGFEVWRLVNLGIFIGVALYLHRRFGRPISSALRSRKERIRVELDRARKEQDEALRKLAEVEARLKGLDAEVSMIREQAKAEASAERERINRATELEMAKLRQQALREIERAAKVARQSLRVFAVEKSVQLAEKSIRRDIRPEDDTRLIATNVERLGRGSH
jgi:F-type H+-transporting ATPase subunit b